MNKSVLLSWLKNLSIAYTAIIVLSIALYVGFDDLIFGGASGTARDTISAALAAIFVLITTMYMLNKQTDVEHKKKLDTEIFKRKFIIYDQLISILQNIGHYKLTVNDDDYRKCLNKHYELVMVAPAEIVSISIDILNLLKGIREVGKVKALDEVNLDEVNQQALRDFIDDFCILARADFNLPEAEKFNPNAYKDNMNKVTEPGSKNLDKFEFNGRSYTKNRLVLEVVRHTVDVKKVENIDKLKILFPDSYWSEGKESSSKNAFIVELKKDAENKRARFFTKKDDIIKFDNSNAEVIVNNQWGTNIDYFLDKVSTELNYEIKRHGPKQ
jgi:hypothetical protein